MKIKKYIIFLESTEEDPIKILKELTLELQDNGLQVCIKNSSKFDYKPTLAISDRDKIYCKNYPYDQLDWLWGKPIITEFLEDLNTFGLNRGKDYSIYAGGLGVNIVFEKNALKKIKL